MIAKDCYRTGQSLTGEHTVSPPSNTAAILKHLSASSGGLSVHQLRDALGGNPSIAELSDELSILSRQGLVHLVKGR